MDQGSDQQGEVIGDAAGWDVLAGIVAGTRMLPRPSGRTSPFRQPRDQSSPTEQPLADAVPTSKVAPESLVPASEHGVILEGNGARIYGSSRRFFFLRRSIARSTLRG